MKRTRHGKRTLLSAALAAAVVAAGTASAAAHTGGDVAAGRPAAGQLTDQQSTDGQSTDGAAKLAPFTITSPDFTDGHRLPVSSQWGGSARCPGGRGGVNQAPAVKWTNVPAGTRGFAFVINDVDAGVAGGWQHWIVYDIPGTATGLAGHGQNPYSQGTTSWGDTFYEGPCPPADGQKHHYVFTVYALDTATIPGTALDYSTLLGEINPHTIWATSMIGTMTLPSGG